MSWGGVVILIGLGIVAAILLGGIVVMAIGGSTASKWSNLLMRYRILAQAMVLLIIALVVYVANTG